MTVEEIVVNIHTYWLSTGKPPECIKMRTATQECYRKLGSWRKALWMASAISDERKTNVPQLKFQMDDGTPALAKNSRDLLSRFRSIDSMNKNN